MRLHTSLRVAVAAFTLSAATASAQTIDFNSIPNGPIAGGSITLSAGGVSVQFSGSGLSGYVLSGFGTGTTLRTGDFVSPITAQFLGGVTADFVQIRNPIYGGVTSEVDIITLSAYDMFNNLLATTTQSSQFISLSATNIAYVTAAGSPQTGYVIDDFTFRVSNVSHVPEPSTWLLMATGLGAIGGVAARRRRA